MPVPFSGGCACGKVRFTCSTEPMVSYACHCTECQKRSGSAFGVSMRIASDGFSVDQGTPGEFERIADSGNRLIFYFCRDCGTSVYCENSGRPGVYVVFAGTLDDPSWVPVQANIWTDSAMPWVTIDPAAENFARGPDFTNLLGAK